MSCTEIVLVCCLVTVSEEDVEVLARILANDYCAVEKKYQIYGMLGLTAAALSDLKKRLNLQNSGSYEFFSETLLQYKNKPKIQNQPKSNATLGNLIECLKKLKLGTATGEYKN
jgi:hypothetical protein